MIPVQTGISNSFWPCLWILLCFSHKIHRFTSINTSRIWAFGISDSHQVQYCPRFKPKIIQLFDYETYHIMFRFCEFLHLFLIAFSDLTLLLWQEGHLACKNRVLRYWHGYLSGARCTCNQRLYLLTQLKNKVLVYLHLTPYSKPLFLTKFCMLCLFILDT